MVRVSLASLLTAVAAVLAAGCGSVDMEPIVAPDASVCTPLTCASASAECGARSDGCGGTLSCGTCDATERCGTGSDANQCVAICTPDTCTDLGATCGMQGDGCGASIDCGACSVAGESCGGGGTPNQCGVGTCTPTTCASRMLDCGPVSDGCGTLLDCGTCTVAGEACGVETDNVCGRTCVTTSCDALGLACGTAPDGCGGTQMCPSCPAGEVCGVGGPNSCGVPASDAGTSPLDAGPGCAVSGITSAEFNPTKTYGTMIDQDGNCYRTIRTFGGQEWMAENLRVTTYRNGDPIPNVTDSSAWHALTTGAYCTYDHTTDVDFIATHGRLYNYHAVSDSRNIAPIGWHVPSDAEWSLLINGVGTTTTAGGMLKEAGTTHWLSPNTGATNESGFTALPSGALASDGSFIRIDTSVRYWTSTPMGPLGAFSINLLHDNPFAGRGSGPRSGTSAVRLVRD